MRPLLYSGIFVVIFAIQWDCSWYNKRKMVLVFNRSYAGKLFAIKPITDRRIDHNYGHYNTQMWNA